MAEVASAFVSLLPSAKGFGRKLDGQIGGDLDRSGRSGGKRFGAAFGGSLKAVVGPAVALLGAAAVGGFLKDSIGEAREAQKVGALTNNVIKTTGGVANVSAKQVGNLATAISNKTGIDDEAIQSGSNLLLTFKNVRNEAGKGAKIFDRATQAAVDLSASGFGDLSGTSKQLGKALNDPIKGISALGRSGVTFTEAQKKQIKGFVKVNDLLGAQKIILKEVESQVGGSAAATATNGEKLRVAFDNFKESIGTALLPILDRVQGFLINRIIPAVSGFADKLGNAAGAVRDFFTQGSGNPAAVAALDSIRDAAGQIGDGFKASIKKLDEFKTKVGTLDLNNLDGKKIGAALSSAVSTAVSSVGKLGVKVASAFGNMIENVDWVGLGIKAGPALIGLVLGLAAGVINGITDPGLWKGIWQHLPEILLAALTIAFLPSKLAGPLMKILERIPFAGRFLAWIVKSLQKIGGKVTSAAGSLLKSFWRGFTEAPLGGFGSLIGRILGALGGIPGRIAGFFSLLKVRIGVWALDAFQALGAGARTAVPAAVRFVASIPGRILRALAGLARLLFPRGAAMVEGMAAGARGKIGAILSAVKGIPGRVVSAVGKLGGTLYNSGRELINGLIRGILSKVGDVGSAVKSVAGKVKGFFPGSPVKEGPLTSWNNGGAGKRLVDMGILAGLDSRKAAVSSAMTDLTSGARLASSVSVPSAARFNPAAAGGGSAGGAHRMVITNYDAMTGHLELVADERIAQQSAFTSTLDRMSA